ncbi:unnamed protein product [Blepharisma stoltei]|uniref:Uncharacterized protein n=1 Tax=Blepharisma stoltei TaxID=1481888 RepID=A0AAU9JM93_9CILI|nr:unnamed protein product [Blepharisma stoltei]
MLRQIRLCPSGCQYWNKAIIARGGQFLAYCSTLAIYLVDLDTFSIHKIISAHEQTISCISWNNLDPSQLASVSTDNSFYLWNVSQDSPIVSMLLTNLVLMMEFNPFNKEEILFLHENGDVKIMNTAAGTLTRKANYAGVRPSILRFHPSINGKFALGCIEGVALSCEMKHDNVKRLEMPKQPSATEDLQWDPLSDKYLLVAFKDGSMVLFDAEEQSILQTFDRQGAGIRSIAWNKAAPGEFFTATDKIAALKLWNVSKKAPVDTIKIGNSGVRQINYLHDRASLICSFKSGSVGVFSIVRKKLEFQTESGHAETIFDVRINPQDKNLLATGSYDGSIKIWDMRTMKNIETLYSDALEFGKFKGVMQTKSVVYGLAWGPGTLIAGCTAKGDVLLFDYAKPVLIHRFKPTIEAPIFRIDWNPLDQSLLAVGTSDNFLIILKLDGQQLSTLKTVRHPHTVYGVSWHPHNENMIATACQDSRVRVYTFSQSAPDQCVELRGHQAKVFNICWNPTFDNILASSSDDRTIGVWDTSSGTLLKRLEGHTHNTRALVWNTEIPWMLITGAWDSLLKVWDIRTGTCMYTANEHHADIYGLCSHPSRPFLFVSASRDTSIRFWSLEDFMSQLELKAIINQDWTELMGAPTLDPAAPVNLSGKGSRDILQKLRECNEIERYQAIVAFFRYRSGEEDFFDMLNYIFNSKGCNPNNQILPIEALCTAKKTRADELEQASGMAYLGSALAKKEDRLIEAAKIHLKLGNLQKYCELMIKLGKWERALAFAPGFCMDYWQNVAQRYAQNLSVNEKEDASAVYLACGKVDKAIHFFQKRKDHSDALLVASSKSTGVFGSIPSEGPRPTGVGQKDVTTLQTITANLAEDFFNSCEPVLSAASHISLQDSEGALTKLLRSHELTYAYILAKLYALPQREILFMLAKKVEKYQDWDLLMKLLEGENELKELFSARLPENLLGEFGFERPEFYCAKGDRALSEGKLKEAIKYLIIGRNASKACLVTVGMFKEYISANQNLSELFEIMEYFAFINLDPVPIKVKAEILAVGSILGAMQSMWKGYTLTHILAITYANLCRHQGLDMPLSPAFNIYISAIIETKQNPAGAKDYIQSLLPSLNPSDVEPMGNILSQLDKATDGQPSLVKNQIKLIGSNLPANNLNAVLPVSIFTRKIIQGPSYIFGKAALGLDEALMWAKVNPFSPMNDGSIINPY